MIKQFIQWSLAVGVLVTFSSWLHFFPSHLAQAQDTGDSTDTTGSIEVDNTVCAKVGNNAAIQFQALSDKTNLFNEAEFTLALYDKSEDVPAIIDAITNSSKTVIVRVGASVDSIGPSATEYANGLIQISNEVGDKPFIAMASHNEANCFANENIPLSEEQAFAGYVVSTVQNAGKSNITFITGQMDTYCANAPGLGGDPSKAKAYISGVLSAAPGIAAVSLPLYITNNYPTAELAIANLKEVAGGRDVYITESGPFLNGSMPEFAKAVQMAVNLPEVKGLLLFNAFEENKDPNFSYTEPFWNPNCRQAFRTVCQNPDEVVSQCGQASIDDYYLYPIDGLAQGGITQIASSLVNQGYQVHCTTPKVSVLAQQGGLFDLVPPGEVTVGVDASQKVDYSGASFPLLRSLVGNGIMSSLETFWGFRDTEADDPQQRQINSAPIYSLLSLEKQCQQQVKQLESTEALCNKLEDPTTCALYQNVPETEYTTKTLLEAYRTVGSSCKELYSTNNSRLTQEQQKVKDALTNVSLYLDKAYRLAFLVLTAELKGEKDAANAFNFLAKDQETGEAREGLQAPHEVRVIAFKVPDVATNKDPNDLGFYDDALSLTKNVLQTNQETKQQQEDENQRRSEFLEAALNPELQSDLLIPPINCGQNCGQPLSQALVQMINANRISCQAGPEDLRYEPSDDIGTPTDITSSEGRTFLEPEGDLVQTVEEVQQAGSSISFDFLGQVTLNTQGDGESQIVSYLVYPAGTEIEQVEDTLAGFVYTDAGVKSFKANPDIPKYFRFNDVVQEFDSTKPQVGVNAPADHPCRQLPANVPSSPDDPIADRQPCTAEAYLEAKQSDSAPRVLGGWLGSLTRTIQKTLYQTESRLHNYITSCTTTEEFLLGKCSGEVDSRKNRGTALSGEGEYCIDWELVNSSIDVEALKQNARSYLTSLPYNFNQPGSLARPGNVYQDERYQELLNQTHRDWSGNVIAPEVINHFENFYGGGRAKLWTISPECNNQICFDYVMDYCEAKGYNPALCVAMNLSESGGSNHIRFGGSYDFGCLAAEANNITSGLECLTDRFFSRDAVAGLDYNGMWKIYAEHGFDSPSYDKIRQYYTDLSGGIGLTAGTCK